MGYGLRNTATACKLKFFAIFCCGIRTNRSGFLNMDKSQERCMSPHSIFRIETVPTSNFGVRYSEEVVRDVGHSKDWHPTPATSVLL